MDEILLMGAAEGWKRCDVICKRIRYDLVTESIKALQVQLTSPVVADAKVCRGQVDVYIVLEDLLKEALPLSQFELLCHVHVGEPLAVLGVCWQTEQEKPGDKWSSAELLIRLHSTKQPVRVLQFGSSTLVWVGCDAA